MVIVIFDIKELQRGSFQGELLVSKHIQNKENFVIIRCFSFVDDLAVTVFIALEVMSQKPLCFVLCVIVYTINIKCQY